MSQYTPTLLETALGTFLHDIGKFMQRAHGSVRHLDALVRDRESDLLPKNVRGQYTHKHALWTDQFFEWLDKSGASFPAGVNRAVVRYVASFHHRPDGAEREIGAVGWIAAEADRLASGMERKVKDEDDEGAANTQPQGWDAFIRTPLANPYAGVDLGLSKSQPRQWYSELPLTRLQPAEEILPLASVPPDALGKYQQRYAALWHDFQAEFRSLTSLNHLDLFNEGLLSLSERYLHAVPSSTKDQPDVSLHDHSRTAAALAVALYRWHEAQGTLDSPQSVRDRNARKFRFLAGDLSGIQDSLFLLASEGVRGVNRILRARSFLLSMTLEGATLFCRKRLGYPVFSLLQNAGGRFLLLLADTPGIEDEVAALRRDIDGWVYRRYTAELSLNLALTRAFSGSELIPAKQENTYRFPLDAVIGSAVEAAKQTPFSTCLSAETEVHSTQGPGRELCSACGVRAAVKQRGAGDAPRCQACADEHRLGGLLPHAAYISWSEAAGGGEGIATFGNLVLNVSEHKPAESHALHSLVRIWRGPETSSGPHALRFLSNYVPVLSAQSLAHPAYGELSEEARESRPGDVKTFEHLAIDARREVNGEWRGAAMLAILKADVDRLGSIFSRGLAFPSLSHRAALSRLTDFFFTGYLAGFLRRKYPNIYTVYAGGDDLLLIGPWSDICRLAPDLRDEFGRWTGNNPNITLSAAIELMKVNHPVNRVVEAAERRLERSKKKRDQLCAIEEQALDWPVYRDRLRVAERLRDYLAGNKLSQAFTYRLFEFDRMRSEVEPETLASDRRAVPLDAAAWRGKWAYQLARNIKESRHLEEREKAEIAQFLNRLLGLDDNLAAQGQRPPLRLPVTLALYENR